MSSCCAIVLLQLAVIGIRCFQPPGREIGRTRWGRRKCPVRATQLDDEDGITLKHPPAITTTNFAGLLASFDAKTGALLPVPEHYVPKAFVEWGMIPTTLEVLSSSSDPPPQRLQTIVLPETGCGVDNLETIATAEEVAQPISDTATVLRFPKFPNKSAYEVVFPHHLMVDKEDDNDDASNYRCRVRILATTAPSTVYGPIELVVERCVEEEPDRVIADTTGGGLDAQSVGRWLGGELNSKRWRSFGERKQESTLSADTSCLQLPLGISVSIADDMAEISKLGCETVRFWLNSDEGAAS